MPEIGVIKNQSERKTRKDKSNKQGFLQGVLTLMFSQVLIKLLGMVYTLYLTNREGFGDEGNGIVSSSYQIYAMLLTISSIGVPNAISKLVSERVAVGDHKGAHRIFKIAFATFAVIGLIGSLMLFFGAGIISETMASNTRSRNDNGSISPAIFFVAIASVMRGYFNGRQNVKATARSQTLEQVFKTCTYNNNSRNSSNNFKCINRMDGSRSNSCNNTCNICRIWISILILSNS